jgi:hypothetical protein
MQHAGAFFVMCALRRTKREFIFFRGIVGSDAQIEFTQTRQVVEQDLGPG